MDKTRTIIAGIVSGVSICLIAGGMVFGMHKAQSDSERLGYFTAAIPAALTILAVWVNPPGRQSNTDQAISQQGGLQVNVAPETTVLEPEQLSKKSLLNH